MGESGVLEGILFSKWVNFINIQMLCRNRDSMRSISNGSSGKSGLQTGYANVFQVLFCRFLTLSSAVAQRLGKFKLLRLLQFPNGSKLWKDKFLKRYWKLFLVSKDILYWNNTKEQPQHHSANSKNLNAFTKRIHGLCPASREAQVHVLSQWQCSSCYLKRQRKIHKKPKEKYKQVFNISDNIF